MTKREQYIELLMAKPNAIKETFENVEIICYDPLTVALFYPRGAKPLYHYRFKSIEQRDDYITERKKYRQKEADDERRRNEKYMKEKEQFKPGVILYSSWGYEQTNIDFYIILERKKDFVTIQEIGAIRVEYTSHQRAYDDRGKCIANPDNKIGEPFRKKISKYASVNLSSFQSASVWDGHALYWSSYA